MKISRAIFLCSALIALAIPPAVAQQGQQNTQAQQSKEGPMPGASPMGMMGQAGMMPQGGMMPMMSMMAQGGMMPMMGMMGMGDHIEGRLAFLKTELKITDAQTSQWNAFAGALRTNAKRMSEMRSSMMQGGGMAAMMSGSAPERLDRMEKMMSSGLEALRAVKAALQPLYAVLGDEQKKTADTLLIGPMGMM